MKGVVLLILWALFILLAYKVSQLETQHEEFVLKLEYTNSRKFKDMIHIKYLELIRFIYHIRLLKIFFNN